MNVGTTFIEAKQEQVKAICASHHVKKLLLFGSALTDRFNPETSDVDLLVEFLPMAATEHARHYFRLMEELQDAYGLPVDLLAPGGAIRNPYFRASLEENQLILYAA